MLLRSWAGVLRVARITGSLPTRGTRIGATWVPSKSSGVLTSVASKALSLPAWLMPLALGQTKRQAESSVYSSKRFGLRNESCQNCLMDRHENLTDPKFTIDVQYRSKPEATFASSLRCFSHKNFESTIEEHLRADHCASENIISTSLRERRHPHEYHGATMVL